MPDPFCCASSTHSPKLFLLHRLARGLILQTPLSKVRRRLRPPGKREYYSIKKEAQAAAHIARVQHGRGKALATSAVLTKRPDTRCPSSFQSIERHKCHTHRPRLRLPGPPSFWRLCRAVKSIAFKCKNKLTGLGISLRRGCYAPTGRKEWPVRLPRSRFACPLAGKSGQINLKLDAFNGTYRL